MPKKDSYPSKARSTAPRNSQVAMAAPGKSLSAGEVQQQLVPILARLEWWLAISLTVLLVAAHVVFYRNAGGLWRDEVNSVNVGAQPTFGETWEYSRWDSFPFAWPMTTRTWYLLGIGGSDSGWRLWGLAMGVAILAAIWWTSRCFGQGPPACSLALMGACPVIIQFGDAVRAYGLGLLLMLLTLSLVWRVVEKPTAGRAILAAAIASWGVNVVYYNAILLLAMCVGGGAVCLLWRQWKRFAILFAVGLAAAISLFAVSRRHFTSATEWNDMVKTKIEFSWLFLKVKETTGTVFANMIGVWLALILLAVAVCLFCFFRCRKEEDDAERRLAVFTAAGLSTGIVVYFVFLKSVGYTTQSWYYLAIIGFAAVLIQAAFQFKLLNGAYGRCVRIALAGIIAAVSCPGIWNAIHTRMTNIDLVAKTLESVVRKDDFIVVNLYWPAITFSRYYHGPANWASIPDVKDHSVHRMDEVRDKMINEPVTPLMEEVARTLRSGHRVYLVGALAFGQPPTKLPPPPLPGTGWNDNPYLMAWSTQVAAVLQSRATTARQIEVPVGQPVNPFENEPLLVFEGWH